nr:hypothetical protein [Tanacetum cinerariifolium]
LESQVSDKTGLGFDSQVFNSQVFNCEELHSHELDNSVPKNPENDRCKTSEGYHATHKSDAPITEDWISDSEDETENEFVPKQKEPSFVPTSYHVKTPRKSVKKVEPVPAAVPQSTVKSLRPVKHVVNKAYSPIRRPINHRLATKNSNFNKKVTTVKVNDV